MAWVSISGSPFGHEQITGSDTAQGISAALLTQAAPNDYMNPRHAKSAIVFVETKAIRWAFDAADIETAANGAPLASGDSLYLDSADQVAKFRFKDATSGEHAKVTVMTFT